MKYSRGFGSESADDPFDIDDDGFEWDDGPGGIPGGTPKQTGATYLECTGLCTGYCTNSYRGCPTDQGSGCVGTCYSSCEGTCTCNSCPPCTEYQGDIYGYPTPAVFTAQRGPVGPGGGRDVAERAARILAELQRMANGYRRR